LFAKKELIWLFSPLPDQILNTSGIKVEVTLILPT
jgi:hypothetical protein